MRPQRGMRTQAQRVGASPAVAVVVEYVLEITGWMAFWDAGALLRKFWLFSFPVVGTWENFRCWSRRGSATNGLRDPVKGGGELLEVVRDGGFDAAG